MSLYSFPFIFMLIYAFRVCFLISEYVINILDVISSVVINSNRINIIFANVHLK